MNGTVTKDMRTKRELMGGMAMDAIITTPKVKLGQSLPL